MIIKREKEIGKRKQAIIQTEEKIGAQSSNAKSERKREFGINNNIQSSEPNGSTRMNE